MQETINRITTLESMGMFFLHFLIQYMLLHWINTALIYILKSTGTVYITIPASARCLLSTQHWIYTFNFLFSIITSSLLLYYLFSSYTKDFLTNSILWPLLYVMYCICLIILCANFIILFSRLSVLLKPCNNNSVWISWIRETFWCHGRQRKIYIHLFGRNASSCRLYQASREG